MVTPASPTGTMSPTAQISPVENDPNSAPPDDEVVYMSEEKLAALTDPVHGSLEKIRMEVTPEGLIKYLVKNRFTGRRFWVTHFSGKNTVTLDLKSSKNNSLKTLDFAGAVGLKIRPTTVWSSDSSATVVYNHLAEHKFQAEADSEFHLNLYRRWLGSALVLHYEHEPAQGKEHAGKILCGPLFYILTLFYPERYLGNIDTARHLYVSPFFGGIFAESSEGEDIEKAVFSGRIKYMDLFHPVKVLLMAQVVQDMTEDQALDRRNTEADFIAQLGIVAYRISGIEFGFSVTNYFNWAAARYTPETPEWIHDIGLMAHTGGNF